ncbi:MULTISPECIES: AAA family ATPase [Enterobacterales]|uniref:AAA family ATPase n=1 Tax=Enterobacterales TaxID=91347 RepID=UPI0003BEFF75|nr:MULTISPECIES: AAA family ATPase [Enterobacteriaceae]EDF6232743.1 AAA family ATPase [Salmonella enterica subsp. enterica serovar Senftenberg]MDE1513181.1 AAA family ATPase [Serratia nevei]HDU3837934.1 AAA family ATPase [Klebsiella pneumoniae subsp. pneumoniae]HED2943935.1 AAA family ATPase [Enterobacter hormaechei subsp. xiangfangensis]AUV95791.1 ParA family protein [Klebsiella oxytoca]
MSDNFDRLLETGNRANIMLNWLTEQIQSKREEFEQTEFYKTYSKAAVSKLPHLSKRAVDAAVEEMEAAGYQFGKRQGGTSTQYAMTIQNIIDIYKHRGIKTYREKRGKAFVIFVVNLKGGVSKTVSTVTMAHGMRAHPSLLHEDLRILVIDLDPQASSTMFLNHHHSIGLVNNSSAQAMLNKDLTREEILEDFVKPSIVPGVDIIPASIEDAFIASRWTQLCDQHLPGMNENNVLRENIIDKISDDYDFIFVDTGPHLDPFLINSLAASDMLMTPVPPPQVDFHSTLKYLTRLPELVQLIEDSGLQSKIIANVGFMSKIINKSDHKQTHSFAKDVFGGDMLDAVLPRLEGFERCGESFDTAISANPQSYAGSPEALRTARTAAEDFSRAVFDRIELLRGAA